MMGIEKIWSNKFVWKCKFDPTSFWGLKQLQLWLVKHFKIKNNLHKV